MSKRDERQPGRIEQAMIDRGVIERYDCNGLCRCTACQQAAGKDDRQ